MGDQSDTDERPALASNSRRWLRRDIARLALLAILVALAVLVIAGFRDHISLANLAEREAELVTYGRAHPLAIVAISFAIYVIVAGLSIPGAFILTIGNAWLFRQFFGPVDGFAAAVVFASFASALGATLAFSLSRYLFHDAIQARFGSHLARFNAAWEREGAFYLFTLRLIPHVPFFIINVVMSLTPIRVRTFWWVSQVAMLPLTLLYVYTGWSVPSLQELATTFETRGIWAILTPPLVLASVLMGVFPLAVRMIVQRIRAARSVRHSQ